MVQSNQRSTYIKYYKNGITLSFEVLPSLSTQPVFSSRPGRNLALLSSNIQEMLQKGAIEKVTENSPGFYSHLFLVPKKTGDLHPIINLKFLNNHIVKEKFKMETQRAIRKALTQGDWVTSIDLKDAYFHIPVQPTARKYLRFTHLQEVYQFKALPFGLTSAPLEFSRVTETLGAIAHRWPGSQEVGGSIPGCATKFVRCKILAFNIGECVSRGSDTT